MVTKSKSVGFLCVHPVSLADLLRIFAIQVNYYFCFRNIISAWLITVPIAALLSAATMLLLGYIVLTKIH